MKQMQLGLPEAERRPPVRMAVEVHRRLIKLMAMSSRLLCFRVERRLGAFCGRWC